jgi:hypothetical protein
MNLLNFNNQYFFPDSSLRILIYNSTSRHQFVIKFETTHKTMFRTPYPVRIKVSMNGWYYLQCWLFVLWLVCTDCPCVGKSWLVRLSLVWIGWSYLHSSCHKGIWFWPCYASQLLVSGYHGLSLPLLLILLISNAFSLVWEAWCYWIPFWVYFCNFCSTWLLCWYTAVFEGVSRAPIGVVLLSAAWVFTLLVLLFMPGCYMVMIFLVCCSML